MRILLLTNRIPFPPDSGYPIVVYNTIKGLLEEGADVSVFSLNPQSHHVDLRDLDDPVIEQIKFQATYIDNSLSPLKVALNFLSRRSAQATQFYKSGSVAKLRNFLQHNEFDIIQLEGLFVMAYLNTIRQDSKAKVIYRAHNIEHQISGGQFTGNSFFTNIYRRIIARRLYRFELENLNKPDAVITISESDQGKLVSLGCRVKITNFPVSIDLVDYVPDPQKIEHPSIFHLGSMDFIPAVEGLEWFFQHVWKDLQALDSGLRFSVAGRYMPEEFYEYEDDFVDISDSLQNARDFMNSKSVMIVPLRSGSGMRVKIIEGMAMKKCIISTSLGAEGIRYEHGKNILIADTADEFYRCILQCATDRKMCEEIGENARRLVEKEYHIKGNSKRLLDFYSELAGS